VQELTWVTGQRTAETAKAASSPTGECSNPTRTLLGTPTCSEQRQTLPSGKARITDGTQFSVRKAIQISDLHIRRSAVQDLLQSSIAALCYLTSWEQIGKGQPAMFEVVITYRPDFAERPLDRYDSHEEATAAAERIAAQNPESVVRAWVRQVRGVKTGS